ncbi:MAG: hypothetical protein KDN19_20480 [Verrucomicrobiae bacterium]|nr:hypothetical protein [Verrucomicrobiae bacterium]
MSDKPSDSEEPKEKSSKDLPPPPPPISLPKPDGFGDINRATSHAKEKEKASKKKKKNERRHPKDGYEKIRNKKGGGGCGCLLALLIILLLPAGGAFLWINQLKTDLTTNQGYEWVTVKTKNVNEAPASKTAYLGLQVLYEVPETTSEVTFVGGAWWLSGTFHEKVTFRGGQLTLEPGSKFLKGLDVQAAKLDIGNAEITGELTGKILQQTAGE